MGATPGPSRAHRALRAHRGDLLALGVLAALALAFLSPALKDGPGFGGFTLDTTLTSLGSALSGVIHNHANGDAVSQMVTWNALDWRLVHSGHFPLWNDYSALGMPQFLNFESSVLSLPDLLSYLAPLREAFLVVVFVKLLLAGSGTYLAARVLGVRPLAGLFGGASYMFAGAFVNWVTWPLSDVFCWCGFLLAFAVLAYRQAKWRYVVLLAVSVAFSIFGGFPEANVMVVYGFAALAIGAAVAGAVAKRRLLLRNGARVVGGLLLGGALAAPLWLPGLQVIALSHRTHDTKYVGLPLKTFGLLFTQGYFGLPTGASSVFALPGWNYYETVAYVGVFGVLLALVGLFTSWRRPVVVGLGLALLLAIAGTYEPVMFHPFFSLIDHISLLAPIRFERMRTLIAFLLCLLGAIGLEQLASMERPVVLRRSYLAAVVIVCCAVGYLLVDSLRAPLVGLLRRERFDALIWPVALCVLALVLVIFLWRGPSLLRSVSLGVLLAAQIGYLFFAGVGIPSYSHVLYGNTPPLRELRSIVGSGLLGLDNGNTGQMKNDGVRTFSGKGLPDGPAGLEPNVNIGYSIRLFGVHDPLTPAAYYLSWPVPRAAPVNNGVGVFVPAITSAALARRYGINYVLVAAGLPAPVGMHYLRTLAGERLYSVPASAQFSFLGGAGSVRSVTSNGDGAFSMSTESSSAAKLVLRVTALPGWHASIDGRAVPLHTYDEVMESIDVPPGRHHIELRYLPRRLVIGMFGALGALVVLLGGGLFGVAARRRRPAQRGDLEASGDEP